MLNKIDAAKVKNDLESRKNTENNELSNTIFEIIQRAMKKKRSLSRNKLNASK